MADIGWPPDWQLVTLRLRRHMPLSRVARILPADEQHLRRLARGEVQQPRFLTGLRLIDLLYDLEATRR